MSTGSKTIIWIIIIIIVIAGVWYGVTRESTPGEEEPIKIGVLAPMTGEAASYGEAVLGGAELAAKEINDEGGINGRLIELVVEDTQAGVTAVTAMQKLINIDEVTAIVGPLTSSSAGPGIPIAEQGGVPIIIIASAPGLPKTGEYIFRNYPSDSLQGKFAAEFIYNDLDKKKAAVIYVNNDWGQGLKEVFGDRFEELGGEVVYEDGVLQASKDLRTQIAKAKEANPDILYFPVYPQGGVAGLKQMKELGLDVPVVGGDAFVGDEVVLAEEAEGTIYIQAKNRNPEEFQDKIREVTGKEPNAFTPFFYDAIKIMSLAIEQAGTDQEAIRNALSNTSYSESVALPIVEFDEDGDLSGAEFEVKLIKDKTSIDYTP